MIFVGKIVGVFKTVSIFDHFLIEVYVIISNISKQSSVFVCSGLTLISF
nr:MAG TPA: hypothetical protein [Caudoviricetes sp.]DAU00957.1 MAG TPA: hypothetical protein [Caudoviricetes sp.]